MTKNKRSNGGHTRAKNLTPERRKEIAKAAAAARWGDKIDGKAKKKPAQRKTGKAVVSIDKILKDVWNREFKTIGPSLRDDIARAVLTGLYSDIGNAQKFATHVMGSEMLLPEAFTRIAYAQADEVLRLRAL